jgi:hypothetical protein
VLSAATTAPTLAAPKAATIHSRCDDLRGLDRPTHQVAAGHKPVYQAEPSRLPSVDQARRQQQVHRVNAPAATTAVFADQAACEAAGKATGEMEIIKGTSIRTLNWLCVPEPQ